jgi:hypothetical protein
MTQKFYFRDAKLPSNVEEQIEKIQKLKAPPPSPQVEKQVEVKKERLFSTSSNSMNEDEDGDEDEDMFDVDEEASALEQMMVYFKKFFLERGNIGLKYKVGLFKGVGFVTWRGTGTGRIFTGVILK